MQALLGREIPMEIYEVKEWEAAEEPNMFYADAARSDSRAKMGEELQVGDEIFKITNVADLHPPDIGAYRMTLRKVAPLPLE